MIYSIDGVTLKEMFLAGAACLEQNKKLIDSLNVFPVPDGDTGTNMSQTMMSAVKEIRNMNSPQAGEIPKAVARGSLRGARGNSGVILSQLFRGFSKAVEGKDTLEAADLAAAFTCGVEMSYKAVLKPKEGTMLTVARVVAEAAKAHVQKGGNILSLMNVVVESAQDILQKTPDMLPVLKEAGVVDSGGKGLLTIYTGFKMALDGEKVDLDSVTAVEVPAAAAPSQEVSAYRSAAEIEFGYCTEFIIQHLYDFVREADIEKLRQRLEKMGDSLVFVGDRDLVKVHVHTNMPGKVLQFALALGELTSIKIDNMREQHRHLVVEEEKPVQLKEMGIVSVAAGDGLAEIFDSMAVDRVVNGGQTANPSIEDIAAAIDKVPAKTVFVLPNNKNIVLAAQQACDLTEKAVIVIPTTTIPQGIQAVLAYNPEMPVEENEQRMLEAYPQVRSGSITYAVRDSHFNGMEIHDGDIMGLQEDKISTIGKEVDEVALRLMELMIDEDSELVTVLYGQDVTEDQANALVRKLEERFPQCEFVEHNGKQPLYQYIFSVE